MGRAVLQAAVPFTAWENTKFWSFERVENSAAFRLA
jgi:hypothetical protein